jgi:hypothetical protein
VERRISGPDGREWVVRSYRFVRPPWRTVGLLGAFDPEEGLLFFLPLLLVAVVLAPVTLLVVPLIVFLVELAARAGWALFSTRRWVVAAHEGPAASRMTWVTDARHCEPVVEQVARQLEYGYERVQPHRAAFAGFG